MPACRRGIDEQPKVNQPSAAQTGTTMSLLPEASKRWSMFPAKSQSFAEPLRLHVGTPHGVLEVVTNWSVVQDEASFTCVAEGIAQHRFQSYSADRRDSLDYTLRATYKPVRLRPPVPATIK
jgi:hypothetical protein